MNATTKPSITVLNEPVQAGPVFAFAEISQTAETLDEVDDALKRVLNEFGIGHFVLYQATDRARRPTGAPIAGAMPKG